MNSRIRSTWRWLINRPSCRLMILSDERLRAESPRGFSHAWVGLVLGSLGWGIASAWLWGGAWKLFNDPGRSMLPGTSMLMMASVVTAAAIVLGPFRRAAIALVEIVFPSNATARSIAAAALVFVFVVAFLRLDADWHRSEYPVPWGLEWIRPGGKMYRVLLLMPLWGAWSMLAVCQFRKPASRTEPAVAAFARGCGPLAAAGCLAVGLAMTIGYVGYLGLGAQLTIPAVTIAAAVTGGLGMCRADGVLSRRGLLAGNMLTQIVFLLAFLVFQ